MFAVNVKLRIKFFTRALIVPTRRLVPGGAKVQVTGQVTGHRSQVTGHRSQVTGHRSQ